MPADLSQLEREVMVMLLQGDDLVLTTLRQQWNASCVRSRELTGVGFYTRFAVPESLPRVQGNKSFNFGDVVAEIDGLHHGAGFILFVKDGVIEFLEGYTYDESWPTEIAGFQLAYNKGPMRDWESLRRKWSRTCVEPEKKTPLD